MTRTVNVIKVKKELLSTCVYIFSLLIGELVSNIQHKALYTWLQWLASVGMKINVWAHDYNDVILLYTNLKVVPIALV